MSLSSSFILKFLAYSMLVLTCSSRLIVRPDHNVVPDQGRSRITTGHGFQRWGRWGDHRWKNYSKKIRSEGYEDQYPFHIHRKEYTSDELTPEDLAQMPKNYKRIVESGGHLEHFKRYYMSDLYDEDMKELEEERKRFKESEVKV